jgi:hypothetical protein
MAKKIVRLRQIFQKEEEGWVEYPISLRDAHGIKFNRVRGWPDTWVVREKGDFVYVQGEDAHTLIEVQLEDRGLAPRYTQHAVADFKAWLKGDQWPKARKWKGDE